MDFLHSFVRWSRTRQGAIILCGSAGVLLCCTWALFGRSALPQKKADYRFMHCPKCGMETMYNPELSGGPCVQCKQAKYVPTATKVSDGSGAPATTSSKLIMLGFIGLILLQLVLYSWISYHRAPPEPEEQDLLKCRCPACKRKLAYPASKAGVSARCPRCRTEFPLPAEE